MAWTANIPVRLHVGKDGEPMHLGDIVVTSNDDIPRMDLALAGVLREAADVIEANWRKANEGVSDAAAHQ